MLHLGLLDRRTLRSQGLHAGRHPRAASVHLPDSRVASHRSRLPAVERTVEESADQDRIQTGRACTPLSSNQWRVAGPRSVCPASGRGAGGLTLLSLSASIEVTVARFF